MYALTIYLDTDDAETADEARTEIFDTLYRCADIPISYGVDNDGPTKME